MPPLPRTLKQLLDLPDVRRYLGPFHLVAPLGRGVVDPAREEQRLPAPRRTRPFLTAPATSHNSAFSPQISGSPCWLEPCNARPP